MIATVITLAALVGAALADVSSLQLNINTGTDATGHRTATVIQAACGASNCIGGVAATVNIAAQTSPGPDLGTSADHWTGRCYCLETATLPRVSSPASTAATMEETFIEIPTVQTTVTPEARGEIHNGTSVDDATIPKVENRIPLDTSTEQTTLPLEVTQEIHLDSSAENSSDVTDEIPLHTSAEQSTTLVPDVTNRITINTSAVITLAPDTLLPFNTTTPPKTTQQVEQTWPCSTRETAATATSALPGITTDYELLPGVGYYKVNWTKVTWEAARHFCEDDGASIAVPDSQQEWDALHQICRRSSTRYGPWLGIRKTGKTWRTLQGATVDWRDLPWRRGFPQTEGDCLVLDSYGVTNWGCDFFVYIICERPLSQPEV